MWMYLSPCKQLFQAALKLLLLFFAGWLLIFIPNVAAQNPAQSLSNNFVDIGAPIVVDGNALFYVQATDNFEASRRANYTNQLLKEAIATDQDIAFDVEQNEKNSAMSITLNDEYLLTITEDDVPPGFSTIQQANRWETILEKAIAKAEHERTSAYLLQRLIWIGIAAATIIFLQISIAIAARIFKFNTSIIYNIIFGSGWLAIAIVSSEWFPQLRSLRYQLLVPFYQVQWFVFFVTLGISFTLSYYSTTLLKLGIRKLAPKTVANLYKEVIEPSEALVQFAVASLLFGWSLTLLEPLVPSIYNFLKPAFDVALIGSLCWLTVKLSSRYLRAYGFKIGGRFSPGSDDAVLVLETIINVLIGIVAVVAFASSLNFDLIGLMASLGIVGLAVAFAAQKILEQLIATLVLYLDRPFITGDYIRLPSGELGKVENIGLRSTKIRSLGTGTIIVMPNSILVNVEVENVTLAKKIMVLLYMDFPAVLKDRERALVQQVILDQTTYLSGVDTNSTSISQADDTGKRLRISFTILGSQDNAFEVRKRLLELASVEISKSLASHGIVFTMEDPTVYVQSPVTI
ncbi:MAG: mechanosensitive ion channel [Limnothrix sp. RL_2_0]|nr:mechanosensitive ion channel [Limnothrix sp. RL_2_0]